MKRKLLLLILPVLAALMPMRSKAQMLTPQEQVLAQAILAMNPTNAPGYLDWLLIKALQQASQPVPLKMYDGLGAFSALIEEPAQSAVTPPPDPNEGPYEPNSETPLPPLPWLFVSGLACPGGQSEPATNYPLVWQARCANEPRGGAHSWLVWTNKTLIDYGDVISATWASQCRNHPVDWNFLRTEVVWTNASSDYVTNTGYVKTRSG